MLEGKSVDVVLAAISKQQGRAIRCQTGETIAPGGPERQVCHLFLSPVKGLDAKECTFRAEVGEIKVSRVGRPCRIHRTALGQRRSLARFSIDQMQSQA